LHTVYEHLTKDWAVDTCTELTVRGDAEKHDQQQW